MAGHGPSHPLKPERLKRTWDLLHAYRAFELEGSQIVTPRLASDEELALFHTPEYIDAVKRLSRGDASVHAWRYHFGPGDNPVFPHMYETEALKTGAGLVAAELVLSGQADVAFSFGGGMHHAGPGFAHGFCVFNDPAVTIAWLVQRRQRIVYIDIDAHHGDGVQDAFYDTDQVMTISLHESGRFLFPGRGFVSETGKGKGEGYAVNIPFPPYTTDEPYVWAFREVVPPLVRRFAPDIIVSQLGADTHFRDPLTHLMLSTAGFVAVVTEIASLGCGASAGCGVSASPRWIAMGGGGYDVTVVPRLWTLAYGIMSGQEFPDPLPAAYVQAYEGGTLRDHPQDVAEITAPPSFGPQVIWRHVERTVGELKRIFGI